MHPVRTLTALLAALACSLGLSRAQEPAGKVLFDPAQPGAVELITANETFGETTFAVKDRALDISVKAGGKSSFPGVVITPKTPWDASGFGHLETTVTNNGTKPIRANLRVDNPGNWQDNPFSASIVTVKPGETKPLPVIMGYSYGKKGYALKPEAIAKAILFIGKSDVEQSFRVTAIRAAGPAGEVPYVDPNTVAVKPAGGQILGGPAAFDPAKQVVARGGAKITASDAKSFTVTFPAAAGKASVLVKPVTGMWNLSEYLQVRVQFRNTGATPVQPAVQIESRGNNAVSDVFKAEKPVAPGATGEIIASFIPATPWQGANLPEMLVADGPVRDFHEHQGGTEFKSNATSGVVISADAKSGAATLAVTGIVADMPPRQPLPVWIGKRPPVEGEWKLTFEDNFDGDKIDLHKWNLYSHQGDYHLGKATAWSKDNVIVKDGKLLLRVEKRKAHHNDDPNQPVSDYATGNCDTFGKWTQRYGYWEARLKMPATPSAFTAFWLMPDRGLEYGADPKAVAYGESRHFQRDSTNGFGMEFDIQEQLSIWGPNRHDFGFHWDHYMKNHKSTGNFGGYFQPDAEGFVTCGMLWTPGRIIIYQQGREAGRWECPRVGSVPEHIILQHITGGWETEGLDDAQLPSDMIFDYVRVWQRQDLASAVDGPKPNDGGPTAPAAPKAPEQK